LIVLTLRLKIRVCVAHHAASKVDVLLRLPQKIAQTTKEARSETYVASRYVIDEFGDFWNPLASGFLTRATVSLIFDHSWSAYVPCEGLKQQNPY
jgi:hypothetical protein